MKTPAEPASAKSTASDGATNAAHFHDLHPHPADMRAEVLAGLALPQKRIAPKFFYDAEVGQSAPA